VWNKYCGTYVKKYNVDTIRNTNIKIGEKMGNIDYGLLKTNLKEIVNEIFSDYIKRNSIKDICGFALYSDENAMSISISINTYKHHENNIKDGSENKLYYKFNTEEWEEIIKNNELDKFNKHLQQISLKFGNKQVNEHRNSLYKLSVEILDEFKTLQLFENMKNDFILLFSISDCELPEIVVEYNKKYNSKETTNEYEQWLKEENEYDDEEED
jgi:hypothetical protein